MGLDMYLSAKRYLWNIDEKDGELSKKIGELIGVERKDPQFNSGSFAVKEITLDVMYWRKANAIHGWFVNHCQGGEDDCREYYVLREQLVELRNLCQDVLNGKDGLEPTQGFFFGSYEKDEWYYKDLQETIDGIDKVLELPDCYDFYYRSSW